MSVLIAVILLILQDPKVTKAESVLAEKPDDANANLIVGKHHLSAGDTDKALPFLLKGSDASLKAAAKAELEADQKNAQVLLEVGDLWTQAMSKNKPLRQACLEHAGTVYAKAWPDLTDLYKLKLRERLNKLYTPQVPGKASVGSPAGWGGILDKDSGVEVSPLKAHFGGAALKVFAKKPGAKVFLQTPVVAVAPGKKLDVSVWVLSDGTDGSDAVRFVMSNSKGGQVWSAGEAIKRDHPVWSKVTASVVCPDEAFDLRFDISFGSTTGTVWLDDISIRVDGRELMKNGGFE